MARSVDPNRIAILPFRVTTSDTLLGEGFAELLASEFSIDAGPRAIDMATVISAWRRAGGGLRTPLPREKALSLARELGAGLVSEGSIVGLGARMTITTSIVTTTSGSARGRPTRVTASSDSIDHALRQTASGLVAALGGQQRTLEGARFTESSEAMRAYLEGLNHWRRGRLIQGQALFERAMTLDTSFAQAAFRRYLANGWALPPGSISNQEVIHRAFMQRARLASSERQIIEAMLGTEWLATPLMSQRIAMLSRIAETMPDSPEAQFLLGDAWYHYGMIVDAQNQLSNARKYIERAVAIDSVATGLRHLIEIFVRQRDTASLRRILPHYARTEDPGKWAGLFMSSAILRDEPELARLRSQSPGVNAQGAQWSYGAAAVADIPAAPLDEMHRRWSDASRGTDFHGLLAHTFAVTLADRARPGAAEAAWTGMNEQHAIEADRFRLLLDMSGDATGLDVKGAFARLSQPGAQQRAFVACETALWRLMKARPAPEDEGKAFEGAATCQRSVRLARLLRDSVQLSLAALEAADSAAREGIRGGGRAFEALLVARAWERSGRSDRAYAAIRFRGHGLFVVDAPWLIPEEIRLSLVARDTANAVRMLEYYLPIIRDAEPPFVAKRDSLRALLDQLRRP